MLVVLVWMLSYSYYTVAMTMETNTPSRFPNTEPTFVELVVERAVRVHRAGLGGLVVEVHVHRVSDLRPHDGAQQPLPRLHRLLLRERLVREQLVHRLLVDAADALLAALQVELGVAVNETTGGDGFHGFFFVWFFFKLVNDFEFF